MINVFEIHIRNFRLRVMSENARPTCNQPCRFEIYTPNLGSHVLIMTPQDAWHLLTIFNMAKKNWSKVARI